MASVEPQSAAIGPSRAYFMALERIEERMERICRALDEHAVPFALVGGQAVALWVATKDPAATRTTKDVDIAIERADLPAACIAAQSVQMEFAEANGISMFLERDEPSPKHAVHLLWAGEPVRTGDVATVPPTSERVYLESHRPVVPVAGLVRMKLQANRRHDLVHLEDMIGVGLVTRELLTQLPPTLAERLESLFVELENRE